MNDISPICIWIAELVPLLATLISVVYGFIHFFKKGRPIFLQSITMAMLSYTLSSLYHMCLTLTSDNVVDGFTPAYLGRIGFFMFLITASYGQLDKIVDDGSRKMRPARCMALIAPACAVILYVFNIVTDSPVSTKISYTLAWIPALFSLYFNLKHAIIPDCDFGFIKAIRLYNVFALALVSAELICLTAWNYFSGIILAVMSVVFGILCIGTMIAAKKGVERWTV